MSTRVLSRKAAANVQPIRWPVAQFAEPAPEQPDSPEPLGEHHILLKQREERIAALEWDLAVTKQQLEQRVREAEAEGRKQGESVAREAADATIQAELAKIGRMMKDIVVSGSVLRRQAEEDLVRLSIAIARRILHREISVDPDALLGLVKAALSKLDQREIHMIRTHPETVPVIRRALANAGGETTIEITADARADRGALLIETGRGQLDASVETQLEEVQRGFTDMVANRG